jgi:hypothetical protein
MRRELSAVIVLGMMLGFAACQDGDRANGELPDAGSSEKPGPSPQLPLLCPSCESRGAPGGDTTDFGSGRPDVYCRGDGIPVVSEVSVSEAEAAGFDLRSEVAVLEGSHELKVRWNDPSRTMPTTLTVDLRATGRAYRETWTEHAPGEYSDKPPCPSDWFSPQVEVRIATADRAVAGLFTGALSTRERPWQPAYDAWVDSWSLTGPPASSWQVTGDGSSFRGNLELAAPVDHDTITVRLAVLPGTDAIDTRGELTLFFYDLGRNAYPAMLYALPPDGCSSFSQPIDVVTCDPWAQSERSPYDFSNPCCASLADDVERDRDADAGTVDR